LLLAIDTSTKYGGVTLRHNGRTIGVRSWHSEHNHTVELMPSVEELLRRSGADLKRLEGIALALGPGRFSTLRVGVAVAKGLAMATGAPVAGVKTLEMEAYPHAGAGLPVCPLLSMGRDELAWALFQRIAGEWRQLAEEHLGTLEELVSATVEEVLFCGEAAPALDRVLKERIGANAKVVADYNPESRLEALAVLGEARLARGEKDDVASLRPFYLRRPSIGRINRPGT